MRRIEDDYNKELGNSQIKEYLNTKNNKPWTDLKDGSKAPVNAKFICEECGICVAEKDDDGEYICSYCGRSVEIVGL